MTQHIDLARGKWQTMTLAEQLGNAGSEFGRALKAQASHDHSRFEAATARFFELINLTVVDPRWRGPRRQELARVKELCGHVIFGDDRAEAAGLEKYFLQFAHLARSNT